LVFASLAEFYAHHAGITVVEATCRLYTYPPIKHWMTEVMKAGAKIIKEEDWR
jgi:hypothetical protein